VDKQERADVRYHCGRVDNRGRLTSDIIWDLWTGGVDNRGGLTSDIIVDLWTGSVDNREGITSDVTMDLWTGKKGLMSVENSGGYWYCPPCGGRSTEHVISTACL
jgi:adhesin HecA-like repeat protein